MSEAENNTMTHETAHTDEETTEPSISLEESAFDANEETIEAVPSNIEAEAAVSLDATAIDVSEPHVEAEIEDAAAVPVLDETVEDIRVEATDEIPAAIEADADAS